MAATRSYEAWSWTGFTVTPYKWLKVQNTFVTNVVDWLATVKIPRTDQTYEVDGEQLYRDYTYMVGTPAAITPDPPINTISTVFVSGDSYGFELGQGNQCISPNSYYTRNGYIIWGSNSGNGGLLGEADYEFSSISEFEDAIDNGDIHQIKPTVYFDVYINGSDKPSLFVNWTGAEDLSPTLLSPNVWIGTPALVGDNDLTQQEGVTVPNTGAWNVMSAGSQSYAGSYSTSYLSIMEAFEQYLNPVSKVEMWGFDGVPANVRLYLRMDYEGDYGDLFRVSINKDGSLYANYKVPGSATTDLYDTVVRIHYGEPDYVLPEDDPDYPGGKDIDDDGPGRYDPDNPPPVEDFEDHEGNGFDGNAVLTKTYAVTAATLQNIGQKLWTQDYFNVLKVQSNPIENIVSVKGLPMAFTGTAEEIKVGDVAFGINGDKVASVQKITIGTIKYMGKYGNYLDFAPYTKTKLNLPYIGLIELDPADLFNSTLKIEYVIDLVTGQCMAILTLDGIPFMNVTGQMGFDIPITATDRVQTELRVASAAITAVGGAAGHMIGGDIFGAGIGGASSALSLMGADYTSQRTASPSPACASFANHLVYLLVDRPLYEGESAGYKHLHGYPCHKYMNLGSLSGFVAVDARTDINIAMTSEENAMLEQLLTQGIYI